MRKHYNPFLMFGSYVGAILVFLWWIIIGSGSLSNSISSKMNVLFSYLFFTYTNEIYGHLASFILYGSVILGFIIGWAIQSIFRSLRKEYY